MNGYHRGLPNLTERIRMDVTDSFGGFLLNFLLDAQKLIKKLAGYHPID